MRSQWSALIGTLRSLRMALIAVLASLLILEERSYAWSIFGREGRRGVAESTSSKLFSNRFGRTRELPSLPPTVVPLNGTNDVQAIDSVFREGADALSSLAEQPSSSLQRATEQMNALFDLCIVQKHDGLPYVSSDVVINALEGLISRALKDIEHDDSSRATDCQPEALEKLLDRINELDQSPSLLTIESLWMIQQESWARVLQAKQVSFTEVYEHIGRTVRLLQKWMDWADQAHTQLAGHPPPTLLLLDTLQTASCHGVKMSEELWNLYQTTMRLSPTNRQGVCQEVHAHLLHILSYSGGEWETRQCQVLRNIVTAVDLKARPSLSEWVRALKASCAHGRVADAAWLTRTIASKHSLNSTDTQQIHLLFLESLLHCKEPGSLLYMERLLMDWAKGDDDTLRVPVTLDMVRMLLQKCCMSRAPWAGGRAERNFYRMINASNLTEACRSDAESVYHVASAYLQEHTFSLAHVRKADNFVRKCVRDVGLHLPSTDADGSCRVFDRLLKAYGSSTFNVADRRKALYRADELFRFFFRQHRDGHVTSEEPDHSLLEEIR